ncbi:MAG TPA: GDSL-type esterase/lipase family protein [Verrucomicrobiae bacterium]|nr:GDSL-type esterase/lipase family protein [Verrucomicrobiae bacterium]
MKVTKFYCWLVLLTAVCGSIVFAAGTAGVAPINPNIYKQPVRVACVGDSITAGMGVSKGNDYPSQLGRMLGTKWVVKNFGVSGKTLLNRGDQPYQKTSAFANALAFNPDVVIIKLGTNDTKPQNWKFKNEFVADYEGLIAQFAKLPSRPRLFICYPAFVAGAGNFGINETGVVEELPMLDKIATDEKAGLIDVHGALKPHPELLPDRVHPNTAGANILARTVFKALTGKEYSGAPVIVETPQPAARY